jgi:hypothetical protein
MYLTWRNLKERLRLLTEDQLDDNATILLMGMDEFFPVLDFGCSKGGDAADGILDHGHLYLRIDD